MIIECVSWSWDFVQSGDQEEKTQHSPMRRRRNWYLHPGGEPFSVANPLQVTMELATEILLCFSSPLCCQIAANFKKRPSVLPLLALCVVRTFLYAGWQVDEAGWRGLTGTWRVRVLSSMYSRASEQVLQNALRICKIAPFCFMHTLPMFGRWRSDCYGYFLP